MPQNTTKRATPHASRGSTSNRRANTTLLQTNWSFFPNLSESVPANGEARSAAAPEVKKTRLISLLVLPNTSCNQIPTKARNPVVPADVRHELTSAPSDPREVPSSIPPGAAGVKGNEGPSTGTSLT